MAKRVSLRRIADPEVAALPTGVRIRTRMYPSAREAEALTAVGLALGGLYRRELADRVRLGRINPKTHARWRTQRKRALTRVSSSRWAGTLTRAVEDQYQLGMRGLAAQVAQLRVSVAVLEQRCAVSPGEVVAVDRAVGSTAPGRSRRRRGYRSAEERFAKTRRLAGLRGRLGSAERGLAEGRPSIVVGGKRLWRNRNNIGAATMNEQEWRARWDAARMFLTADGESGKVGGNETIRVDEFGRLRIKTPTALADRFGSHVVLEVPVRFSHRGNEWADRVAARQALRYDIHFDAERGRWYLDASWKATPEPILGLDELRTGPVLGVDLNADHLAACVLDASGNPVGEPFSIETPTAGLAGSRRDGRVRAAITLLLDRAQQHNCSSVVVESLDFADARAAGRETLGRGQPGKRLRRNVAGIPTRCFRGRLIAMANRRGIAVISVDAAYTSRWGAQHWREPLEHQTSDPATVTGHHGAAAAIGRRGLGLGIRRRPAGPRSGQRTAAGTPPTRHAHHPDHGGRRGSSGPPTPTRWARVRRTTPARRGQHRSGRSWAGLNPAHQSGTVTGHLPWI